jgi:hypothetical protein
MHKVGHFQDVSLWELVKWDKTLGCKVQGTINDKGQTGEDSLGGMAFAWPLQSLCKTAARSIHA